MRDEGSEAAGGFDAVADVGVCGTGVGEEVVGFGGDSECHSEWVNVALLKDSERDTVMQENNS